LDQDCISEPFETRKATLASLLRASLPGLRLNEHLTHPGDIVFCHACKLGLDRRTAMTAFGNTMPARVEPGGISQQSNRITCCPNATDFR
jgi:hypothetical protein